MCYLFLFKQRCSRSLSTSVPSMIVSRKSWCQYNPQILLVKSCLIGKPVLILTSLHVYSANVQRSYPYSAMLWSTTKILISDWSIKRFNSDLFTVINNFLVKWSSGNPVTHRQISQAMLTHTKSDIGLLPFGIANKNQYWKRNLEPCLGLKLYMPYKETQKHLSYFIATQNQPYITLKLVNIYIAKYTNAW